MMHLRKIYPFCFLLTVLVALGSCAVKDDLPFPIKKAIITAFEVEGQCDASGEGYAEANIDKENYTIDLYIDDRVDISDLRVKRFEVNFDDTKIEIENNKATFPEKPFSTTGNACPTVDFSKEVTFVLTTYQTYRWKVRVHQVILREMEVENQVGTAVIDNACRSVIVYVASDQDLKKIKVNKMTLGGVHGQVSPDPTGQILDFSSLRTFQVTYGWAKTPVSWNVYIYNAVKAIETTADIFPHANKAYVSGSMQNGTTPIVQYRQQGSSEWQTVSSEQVTMNTATYEAIITSLLPGTDYECQVTAGDISSPVRSFRTTPNLQLENTSFDDWHIVGTGSQALYNPWAENGSCYWDTGNRGATTVGSSNSTFGTEGGRTYANLQSKYIIIKFAAGNIFTGTYLKTDGTNGILSFGRPFNSFPSKLQFDYTYKTSVANKGGGKWYEGYSKYISKEAYDRMSNHTVNDSCCVYIALLGDKDEEQYDGITYPFIIRTKTSELHLFNPNDENVIAYGQFTSGDNQTEWTTKTITLDYHYNNRTPKYIVVVCSSSKYGDYFIGSDTSLMRIDNLKLLYD